MVLLTVRQVGFLYVGSAVRGRYPSWTFGLGRLRRIETKILGVPLDEVRMAFATRTSARIAAGRVVAQTDYLRSQKEMRQKAGV